MLTDTNATQATGEIRALRRAAGISQQELATRAACSISYVRLLEQGFAPEHSDVLPRVLRALDYEAPEGNEIQD